MTQAPLLFDRSALARRRQRAARKDPFLHLAAADDLQDRLALVNKRFTTAAVVTASPEIWAARLPGARVVPDEDVLALDTGAHDLVVHFMALHWSNDPVGQMIQCRRALKSDGLFLAVLFGGQTLSELRTVLAEAESRESGGLSPRVAPMAEIRDLGALLQRAGFNLPVADSDVLAVAYRDLYGLMRDLRDMGETNVLANRMRRPTRKAVFERANALYAEHFPSGPDRIRASFEFVTLTGWAPDPSQPQPLRPGSATTRLADALSTTETKLQD